jgi:hypothetical protein
MKSVGALRQDFARLFTGAGACPSGMGLTDVTLIVERGLGIVLNSTPKDKVIFTDGSPTEEARRQWLKAASPLAHLRATKIKLHTCNGYDVIVKQAISAGHKKNAKKTI